MSVVALSTLTDLTTMVSTVIRKVLGIGYTLGVSLLCLWIRKGMIPMNEIGIMYGSEGFEVSLKSDTLSFDDLEKRALILLGKIQGKPSKPDGYHS